MLSRSYLVLGRLDEATQASERVLKLKPHDAQALAHHADVLPIRARRVLDGEPRKSVERALKLDTHTPKTPASARPAPSAWCDGHAGSPPARPRSPLGPTLPLRYRAVVLPGVAGLAVWWTGIWSAIAAAVG